MVAVAVDSIRHWTSEVLLATGLAPDDARIVADSLVFADLRGVTTHGVLRLPTYVARIRAGGIDPAGRTRVVADLGALVVVDSANGPGAATAMRATSIVIERAREHGIGCVIARNANHFGASAYFTNQIADAGMLGIAACNTEPVMCAPFGGAPVLGTNPIALAVPLPRTNRPQLDMATTTTSQGRLIIAARDGEDIPLGWAVDRRGRPTTLPQEGLEGALLPMGGPKGFGLAFAVDALLALAGANVSTGVAALHGDDSAPQRLGHLLIAIRADAAGTLEDYQGSIRGLAVAVHASGTGLDVPAPLVPGEPEVNRERDSGGLIDVSSHVRDDLAELARSSGVRLPTELTSTDTNER